MSSEIRGFLEIQDGIYINKEQVAVDSNYTRNFTRTESITTTIAPKFTPAKSPIEKTLNVDVTCFFRASIYNEFGSNYINRLLRYDKNYKAISSKNLSKSVKEFICPIVGKKQSSIVRKRLIGLEKIHKSISNEQFRII
jgi:hypothetical protein